MSEFEIQQLLIATRWEFDIPTMLYIVVSLAFILVGMLRSQTSDVISVRALQVAYVFAAGFLYIRAEAAIVRAQKLGALLSASSPSFEIANPALQMPTYYLRVGTFLVVFVVTLLVLWRASRGHR
jgi:hypothetical protein